MMKNGVKILVVDDDEIVRDIIISLLSSEGYTVKSAQNGLDAIETLKMENIKMVITDLRMPGADGIEVLKEAIKMDPDRAVIILTAYGTLDTALKAIQEGAYDYMTKPFKMEEMIIRVNNAYERTILVIKMKTLVKSLREILADLMLFRGGENNHSRLTINWLDHIEELKRLEILDQDEARLMKERLIGE